MATLKHAIAVAIAARRRALGLTVAELAERAGYGERTVERLEAGHSVRSQTVWHVCQVLGLVVDVQEETHASSGQDCVHSADC